MAAARANWIDRVIAPFAPGLALRRAAQRAAFEREIRGYDGAARGRDTDGWRAPGSSADAEIAAAGPRLRARSRDLTRNNPHAAKAVSVWATNLVGDGVMPRAASGNDKLDKVVNDLWAAFAKTCDADGQLDFYGLQTLACREMVEAGEVLVQRFTHRNGRGPVPLQLQVLEADHLDSSRETEVSAQRAVVQGIEFATGGALKGQRTGYWLYRQHPGGRTFTTNLGLQSVRVPANDIVHLYEKQRTQVRGVPWSAPIVRKLRDIDDYDVAEGVRKKTEACVVGIVLGADEETQESIAPSIVDAEGRKIEQFEPGLIAYARGGKDIKFNTPGTVGGYADYRRVGLHTVAAGYRVPYELLSGDLSQVNYSSIRAGLVEFRRLVRAVQWQIFIPMFCQRVWDWFCEACFLAGLIPTPEVKVEWAPPAFEAVDPLKDAMADLLDMRSGKRTLFDVIASTGRNPEDVLREAKKAAEFLDALELVFDSDPRKVAKSGALQVVLDASNSKDKRDEE